MLCWLVLTVWMIAAAAGSAQPVDGDDDDSAAATPRAEVDDDFDLIPNALDDCPQQPETVNGYLDNDGCPDQIPIQQVVIYEDPIPEMSDVGDDSARIEIEPQNAQQSTKLAKDRIDEETLKLLEELMAIDPELAEEALKEIEELKRMKKGD
jgi:hypothetical protein